MPVFPLELLPVAKLLCDFQAINSLCLEFTREILIEFSFQTRIRFTLSSTQALLTTPYSSFTAYETAIQNDGSTMCNEIPFAIG